MSKTKTSKQFRDKEANKDERWERLGINKDALSGFPTITQIINKGLGSVDVAVEYLRGSSHKDAIELIRLWDGSTKIDKKELPFEAFCLAASSNPSKMMGLIMEAVTTQVPMATELMVAAAHPAIVETTINNAKKAKGFEDRKTIHQNRGFLPIPKNNTINNYGSISQDNRKQIANISAGQLSEDDDKISRATEEFNANRQLRAGEVDDIVVDVLEEE